MVKHWMGIIIKCTDSCGTKKSVTFRQMSFLLFELEMNANNSKTVI